MEHSEWLQCPVLRIEQEQKVAEIASCENNHLGARSQPLLKFTLQPLYYYVTDCLDLESCSEHSLKLIVHSTLLLRLALAQFMLHSLNG